MDIEIKENSSRKKIIESQSQNEDGNITAVPFVHFYQILRGNTLVSYSTQVLVTNGIFKIKYIFPIGNNFFL